ncbi:MAG: GntR family transcriptional regulator [Pseudomonadota bacterium]
MSQDRVALVYRQLRSMVERFDFKPESQINEVALAKKFGTSRTPVREALNRLVAEGYLTFQARRGFFVKPFNPDEVIALYETRVAIETEMIRLALARNSHDGLDALIFDLDRIVAQHQAAEDLEQLLDIDELFHLTIARGAKNHEMERILTNLNSRIRFFRLIDLKFKRSHPELKSEADVPGHRAILEQMRNGEAENAARTMRHHIERRRDEATEAAARAFASIYFADSTT